MGTVLASVSATRPVWVRWNYVLSVWLSKTFMSRAEFSRSRFEASEPGPKRLLASGRGVDAPFGQRRTARATSET